MKRQLASINRRFVSFCKSGSLETCVAASTLSCLLILQACLNINPNSSLVAMLPETSQKTFRAIAAINFGDVQIFAIALLVLGRYIKNLYLNLSVCVAILGAFSLTVLNSTPALNHNLSSLLSPRGLALSYSPFKNYTLGLIFCFLVFALLAYISYFIASFTVVKTVVLSKKFYRLNTYRKKISKLDVSLSLSNTWVRRITQILIFSAAISQVVYLSVLYQNRQGQRRANIQSVEITPSSSKPAIWSYQEQGNWKEHYANCSTSFPQSPIDIPYGKMAKNRSVFFPEGISKFEVIDSEPLGAEVRPMNGMFLTIADQIHKLESVKLKSPSEHKRDGVSFPLELQLYLRDSESGFTAISQVYTIGEANEELQKVIGGIVSTNTLDKKVGLDLANLLSVYPGKNAAYSGSLPFPPCNSTNWIHLEEVKNLSWTQFKYFSQVLGTKRRNLQIVPSDIARN